MKPVSNNPINISKGGNGGFVQEQIIDCINDIVFKLRLETDVEYNDVTYKELYIKAVQFAKEIDEILSSEISQRDDMFDATPNVFSFRNDKLV